MVNGWNVRSGLLAALLCVSLCVQANVPWELPVGELRLPDGVVVANAVVIGKDAAGVQVRHPRGVSYVRYAQLPPDVRKAVGYDPRAERAHYAAIQQRQRAAAAAKLRQENQEKRDELRAEREKEIAAFQKRLNKLSGEIYNGGTGFFVTHDGYLITNEHVIDTAVETRGASLKVVWLDKILDAKVVARDEESDVAIVKVALPKDLARFPSLPLSRELVAPMGRPICTVGFPRPQLFGWTPKLYEGSISSVRGFRGDQDEYQLMMPVQGGNSGGAVVDLETGTVVGILSAKINETYATERYGESAGNVSFARKIRLAGELMKEIKDFPYGHLRAVPSADAVPHRDALIRYVRDATVCVVVMKPKRRKNEPNFNN